MPECMFCGGSCGRVCRGLGFKNTPEAPDTARKALSVPESTGTKRNLVRASLIPKPEKTNVKDPSRPKPKAAPRLVPGSDQTKPIPEMDPSQDIPAGSRNVAVEQTGSLKRGRPRIDVPPMAKPWIALGLTERTYYRRQAEKREQSK